MLDPDRQRVLDVAASWIGTPYHEGAKIKGVGVDCAHLLAGVFEEAGLVPPVPIAPYPAQWYMHRAEEKFLGYVQRYACEIAEAEVQPGDVAMYRFGRCFSHGAIVLAWPHAIIHAETTARRVIRADGLGGNLKAREKRFFSIFAKQRMVGTGPA